MEPKIGAILLKIFPAGLVSNVERGCCDYHDGRFHNHLDPKISKDQWTDEEDQAIIEAHKRY